MEVRAAYCAEDFEWPQLQRLAAEDVRAANVRLMRRYAESNFTRAMQQGGPDPPAGDPGGAP